jgi:hypothetical protein
MGAYFQNRFIFNRKQIDEELISPQNTWITMTLLWSFSTFSTLIVIEHVKHIDEEILHHHCMDEELYNESYGIPAIRHRKQQVGGLNSDDRIRGGWLISSESFWLFYW